MGLASRQALVRITPLPFCLLCSEVKPTPGKFHKPLSAFRWRSSFCAGREINSKSSLTRSFPIGALGVSSWMIPLGLLSAAVVGTLTWWIWRFVKADADMRLLGLSPPEPGFFEGKVVWITGASQGLGMQLARYFSEQGAKLVLSSRRRDQLQKVADSCKGPHARDTVILPFDLEARGEALSEVARMALALNNNSGPDYIILNAGGSQHSLAIETKATVAERLISLNAVAPIALAQELLPGLVERGKGHFVVISSMAAVVPSAGQAIYSASKHALNGYFQSLRSEMADSVIKVTVCCPGPIATGTEEQPRVIFGAEGILTESVQTGRSGKRMSIDRAVELISTAIKHNLPECWIVGHPILLVAYIDQYLPRLAWKAYEQNGPSRAKSVKAGDGYSFSKSTILEKQNTK